MSAPAASAIVALSRAVMTGLPWRRTRWKIEDAMPTDLTVILEHRPGELARLAEITGDAGVTIHGLAAFTGEGKGVVHVLLDDDAVAGCRAALDTDGSSQSATAPSASLGGSARPGSYSTPRVAAPLGGGRATLAS